MLFIGLDLVRQQDHSALAVVERVSGQTTRVVRGVKRIPLGTPYKEVLAQLRRTAELPGLLGNCRAVVDATGLGAPVASVAANEWIPESSALKWNRGGEN